MAKTTFSLVSAIQAALFQFVKYRVHLSIIFYFLLIYNNKRVTDNLNYYLIISFSFWHFALFLFDRIYDRELDKISQPDEYVKDNYAKVMYGIVAVALIISFISFFYSGYRIIYWLLLLPITFLYPLKLYRELRVKNIFLIKNLFSAMLIFCFPLLLQIYLLSNGNFDYKNVVEPIVSLFIYVMIGEVFWDIRDCSTDKQFNIKTIPNTFGIGFTKVYILALIIIDGFLTNSFFSTSAYIYLFLITFVKEQTHRLVYHLPPLLALIRFLL